MECSPHILVDSQGLIGAPDETAGEESEKEQYAIIKLRSRARHIKFIKEPVEVQERGGELIEDEGAAVKIDKWPLRDNVSLTRIRETGILTKPKENTTSALKA